MKSCGIVLVGGLMVTACASGRGPSLGLARNIEILETQVEREQDSWMCKDFRLTASDVARFLNSAVIITPVELHDHFDFGPCVVRGTAVFRGMPASWQMRIGGTGSVTFWDDFVFLIADDKQRYDPQSER